MPSLREILCRQGLSEGAAVIIENSTRQSTRSLYKTYIRLWNEFCMSKHKDPVYSTAIDVVNFLLTLMDNNRGSSAIGTARSALASIVTLKCGTPVGSHPLVKNFTQGVFNLKPPTPRYVDIWDPETVLKFLKSWSPAKSLSLTKLVKKMCINSTCNWPAWPDSTSPHHWQHVSGKKCLYF